MGYLKRSLMPESWPLSRKTETFVVRPLPGPHAIQNCIPLQVFLRDILGVAATAKEAKAILNQGKVLVDRKPRKEPAYPVGFMDVIEIPDIRKHYRVNLTKKGLVVEEIAAADAAQKLCRIVRKTTVRKGRTQLTLHDGRNILVDDPAAYHVGDSVAISLPDQKILKHYRLEKGARAAVLAGRNKGASGTVKEIHRRATMIEKSTVTVTVDKKDIQTLAAYVMARGG